MVVHEERGKPEISGESGVTRDETPVMGGDQQAPVIGEINVKIRGIDYRK